MSQKWRRICQTVIGGFLLVGCFVVVSRAQEPRIWTDKTQPRQSGPVAPRYEMPYAYRWFWQIDFWTKEKAFEEDENALNRFAASLITSGYDSSERKIDVTSGLGIRTGVFFPTRFRGWEWGGSLGYIWGPSQEAEVRGFDATVGSGKFTNETDTTFIRLLGEVEKRVILTRHWGLRLRGGMGWVRGRIRAEDRYSGSFVSVLGFPASASFSENWSGFTWEFIPSVVWIGRHVNVEIGIGYAGFPKLKTSTHFNKFEWMPIGFRLGLAF